MNKAVVLLSGGLDSTVTLAFALDQGYDAIPLTITYGQRHARELRSAQDVVAHYGVNRHVIIELDLSSLRTSALISREIDLPQDRSEEHISRGVPVTYVPARNIIFLSIAAGLCEAESADRVFIGVNSLDYSGYPDCRPEFLQAFQRVLDVGTKAGLEGRAPRIEAPLLNMTKAEIVRLGKKLGAPLSLTWSCYRGAEKACGRCDSCLLRLKGFREAGVKDEIPYEVGT